MRQYMAWWSPPAWWHGARIRRLAAMGGRYHSAQSAEPRIKPFTPTTVDEAGARGEIEQLVSGLAPGGVDEATGHSLDNLINAWADQWIADVTAQHAWYVARIVPEQTLSEATSGQVSAIALYDRNVLAHTVVAIESALLRLVGLGHGGVRPAGGRRWPSFWWRRIPPGQEHHPGVHSAPPAGDGIPGEPAAPDFAVRPEEWEDPAEDPGRPSGPGPAGEPGPATEEPAGPVSEPGPGQMTPDIAAADLNLLLGPAQRGRLAAWGDSGHADATLLGGRSRLVYLHVGALVLAAGADFGAFFQIVEQVMNSQPWLEAIVVAGFTGVVLYLAHASGTMLRDRKAGARWTRGLGAAICLAVWLGLGAAAFYLRLHFQPQSGLSTFNFSASGSPSNGGPDVKPYNAILFLALYLGTGMVACVGAYLSHNPFREAYKAALRGYRKATERVAVTTFLAGAESARLLTYQAEFDAAAQTLDNEVKKRLAFAAKLKQTARVLIAQHMKDPAVTDAMFGDDWRPYP